MSVSVSRDGRNKIDQFDYQKIINIYMVTELRKDCPKNSKVSESNNA